MVLADPRHLQAIASSGVHIDQVIHCPVRILVHWSSLFARSQISLRIAIMHPTAKLFSSCLITTFIPAIAAAPVGAALPLSIPTGQAIGPPGSSGSAYGSEAFLGPNGNPVDPKDSAMVTNYDLVPGQTADADLGLYLDLQEAKNPQPIRGSRGGTDSGPREKGFC